MRSFLCSVLRFREDGQYRRQTAYMILVSMGTNSALICRHVVENAYQGMAIQMMALVQAVDCLEMSGRLSSSTKKLYDEIRTIVPAFKEDTPKYQEIRDIIDYLKK